MTKAALAFHKESTVLVAANPEAAFQLLDDHRRLATHMEKPSLMMAGASMHIETDAHKGQTVGSVITLKGRVLGMDLSVKEKVTDYVPPLRKTWETIGTPRLLVIGPYRMGFTLAAGTPNSILNVWIDYDLPTGWLSRWLGKFLGGFYANWCVQRMSTDAAQAFCKGDGNGNA